MAGGPLTPKSIDFGSSGFLTAGSILGSTNSRVEHVDVAVDASNIDADSTVQLTFEVPPALPTGTAKLRIIAIADATSGDLIINPKWKSVAAGETFDTAAGSMNAEGNTTITWASGDDEDYKETKITLDADTIVAGEIIQMDLVVVDTGTTLATDAYLQLSIIWE